jgi:hypothetical protein
MIHQIHRSRKFIITAFAIACLAPFAIAQNAPKAAEQTVKFPDTPAGKTVAGFFKAFNSGNVETMKKYHQDHGGNVENAEKDKEFFDQTGGLKVHSVTRSEKPEIEVLVQTQNGGRWMSFVFTVGQEAPYGIQSIRAKPASAPNEKSNQ